MLKKSEKNCTYNVSSFVKLASVLGGILLLVVALFVIFARAQIEELVAIAWAFVVLGIVLGYFQYKSENCCTNKNNK